MRNERIESVSCRSRRRSACANCDERRDRICALTESSGRPAFDREPPGSGSPSMELHLRSIVAPLHPRLCTHKVPNETITTRSVFVPGRRTRSDIIPQRDHERCPPPRPSPQGSPTPKERFFSGTIPHLPEALDALRKPLERGPPLRTWHDPSVVVSVSAYSGDPHLCPLQSRVSTRFCSGSEGSRRYPPGERGDPIEATPLVRHCAHDRGVTPSSKEKFSCILHCPSRFSSVLF